MISIICCVNVLFRTAMLVRIVITLARKECPSRNIEVQN